MIVLSGVLEIKVGVALACYSGLIRNNVFIFCFPPRRSKPLRNTVGTSRGVYKKGALAVGGGAVNKR
jgi:hypothetical protein